MKSKADRKGQLMEDVNSQSIKALVGKLICYLGTRQQALKGLFLSMESQSPRFPNGSALRPHLCFFKWDLSDIARLSLFYTYLLCQLPGARWWFLARMKRTL